MERHASTDETGRHNARNLQIGYEMVLGLRSDAVVCVSWTRFTARSVERIQT